MGAIVCKVVGDRQHWGRIENIGIGCISHQRLYRVQYDAGHNENIVEGQVANMMFQESSGEEVLEENSDED
eukprot:1552902-Karenia_brevis.AAC.1